jgi:subtilisin
MTETLPAWSLPADAVERIGIALDWPERITREWAWEGSTGAGVRVCILDSGVEPDHPKVGPLARSVAVTVQANEVAVEDDAEGDLAGHGTACAGIVRSLAPECDLTSVRVLGAGFTGSGRVLLEGLRWAVAEGFDVINMSLSTTKKEFASVLHELADDAYFRRTVVVASLGGSTIRSTGNSFATPHLSGICALVRAKHPELTPFQLKSVLYLTATNVGAGR